MKLIPVNGSTRTTSAAISGSTSATMSPFNGSTSAAVNGSTSTTMSAVSGTTSTTMSPVSGTTSAVKKDIVKDDIANSFASINIHLESTGMTVIEESPTVTFDMLIGIIGMNKFYFKIFKKILSYTFYKEELGRI